MGSGGGGYYANKIGSCGSWIDGGVLTAAVGETDMTLCRLIRTGTSVSLPDCPPYRPGDGTTVCE